MRTFRQPAFCQAASNAYARPSIAYDKPSIGYVKASIGYFGAVYRLRKSAPSD